MHRFFRQQSSPYQPHQLLQRKKTSSKAGSKTPMNPVSDQQITKQLRKSQEIRYRVPLYRFNKTKLDKPELKSSDNQFSRMKDRGSNYSPYKQEPDLYNFSNFNAMEVFHKKKKGRTFFYKKNQQKMNSQDAQTGQQQLVELQKQSQISQQNNQFIEKNNQKAIQQGIILEQLHFQMVRSYQRCKQLQIN